MNPRFFRYDLDLNYTSRRGLDLLELEIKRTSANEYNDLIKNGQNNLGNNPIQLLQVIKGYFDRLSPENRNLYK